METTVIANAHTNKDISEDIVKILNYGYSVTSLKILFKLGLINSCLATKVFEATKIKMINQHQLS